MIRLILLLVGIIVAFFLFGPTVIENVVQNPVLVVGFAGGIFVLVLSMTNFEKGIMLLLFIIPFSVQLNLESSGGAPVDFGIDDFLIFFLAVVWLVYLGKTKQAPFVKNPLTWPFMAYLAGCLLSFIPMSMSGKGNIPLSLLHLVKWFEYVFIYFIMLKLLDQRPQIIRFTLLSLGIAVFVACIQLFQMITHIGIKNPTGEGGLAMAGFESNGILGAYYVFFLSILLSFLIRLNLSMNLKFLLIGVSLLMAVMLFFTYSRAAYLGFFIALVLTSLFNRRAAIFVLAFGLLITPVILSRKVSQEIKSTVRYEGMERRMNSTWGQSRSVAKYYAQHQGKGGIRLDLSSVVRLVSWAKARGVIYHHPLFGTGYWSTRFLSVFGFSTVHSWYITILLETGILGLLGFIWICWAILFNVFLLFRETQDEFYQALSIGYFIGFIGVLVHCFFGETFESFRMTGPLWMMTSIVVSAKRIEEEFFKTRHGLLAA